MVIRPPGRLLRPSAEKLIFLTDVAAFSTDREAGPKLSGKSQVDADSGWLQGE
jgi:hypothetical protein